MNEKHGFSERVGAKLIIITVMAICSTLSADQTPSGAARSGTRATTQRDGSHDSTLSSVDGNIT